MEYPRINVGVYLSSLKTLGLPAKDLAKFRWARRNLADVWFPYVLKQKIIRVNTWRAQCN